jgi:hypothetical protein
MASEYDKFRQKYIEYYNKIGELNDNMNKNYYKVTNFSFVSPGDYFYIIENDRPQKIKCISVNKIERTKHNWPSRDSNNTIVLKEIKFVRVSNQNNNKMIDNKENIITELTDSNQIIAIVYTGILGGGEIANNYLPPFQPTFPDIWKKKLEARITRAPGASTFDFPIKSGGNNSGGKRKKTKRRRQTRRKTKRQRKHK